MPRVLASATVIQVNTVYKGKRTTIARLSSGNDARYWEMVRSRCRFGVAAPPAGSVDFAFEIHASPDTYRFPPMSFRTTRSEPMIRYGYASASGRLGQGEEWCEVPAEVKAWMDGYRRKLSDPPPSVLRP